LSVATQPYPKIADDRPPDWPAATALVVSARPASPATAELHHHLGHDLTAADSAANRSSTSKNPGCAIIVSRHEQEQ